MKNRIRINGKLYEEVTPGRRIVESKWRNFKKVDYDNYRGYHNDLPTGKPPRLFRRENGSVLLEAILAGCKTRKGPAYYITLEYDIWEPDDYELEETEVYFRSDSIYENAETKYNKLVNELDRLNLTGSSGEMDRVHEIARKYGLKADN